MTAVHASRDISTRTVIREADLDAIEPAWRALRAAHGAATVNTNPACYRAVLAAQPEGTTPHVAVLERAGSPCGLVVARRSRRRVAPRLGYLRVPGPRVDCVDVCYGGLVTDGRADAAEAVAGHLRGLLADGGVDLVTVHHLPAQHPLADSLADTPRARIAAHPTVHWRFRFASGPFRETLGRMGRKHRYNLRRADRRLADACADGLRLDRVTDADALDRFLADAEDVTARGYQGAIGAGLTRPRAAGAVLRAAATQGGLRSYVLRDGTRALAFHAGVVEDGTYHLLATAFDPAMSEHSPGQVLLLRVMQDLRDEGIDSIDYGFGDAAYKRMYGTDRWEERSVALYGRSLRARAAAALDTGIAALGRTARRFADPERVKRRWRDRLAARAARRKEASPC